jgi:hypothetical protein
MHLWITPRMGLGEIKTSLQKFTLKESCIVAYPHSLGVQEMPYRDTDTEQREVQLLSYPYVHL